MNPVELQIEELTDRLGHMPGFRHKKMFGGASLYSDEVVFCMITRNGTPHFRIGPSNIVDFENAKQKPFAPGGKHGDQTMPYYTIPADVMDDQVQLEHWAAKAVTAAKEAKKK